MWEIIITFHLTVGFWKVAVFFYYSGAEEAVNYQTTKINIAMKKFFVFLFLVSSVSFVGCAKKTEAPVEAPVEAPAAPVAPAAEVPAAAPAAPAAEAPAATPAAGK